MENTRAQNEGLVWMLLGVLALMWGSSFLLMKKGLVSFSPLEIGAIRIALGALCLLPVAVLNIHKVKKEAWLYLFIVGWVGNGIPAFLFPLAEQVINSATAGFLNALTPAFSLIVGVLFFGVALQIKKLWGIGVGFIGAIPLSLGGEEQVSFSHHLLYVGYVLLATFLYGISINTIKKHLNETPPLVLSAFCLQASGIPYLCYLLFFSDIPARIVTDSSTWPSLGYVATLSLLGTVVGMILFSKLVQITDAIKASTSTYLIPVVALGWGLYDGESLTALQLLGACIVLVGVYLTNKK